MWRSTKPSNIMVGKRREPVDTGVFVCVRRRLYSVEAHECARCLSKIGEWNNRISQADQSKQGGISVSQC